MPRASVFARHSVERIVKRTTSLARLRAGGIIPRHTQTPARMLSLNPLSLRRHAALWICLAIGGAGLAASLLAEPGRTWVRRYNDDLAYFLMASVVAGAMIRRARSAAGLEEGRLWRWLGCSFGAWAMAELVATATPDPAKPGWAGVARDLLYFCSYSAWFLGMSQAPHRFSGWTARQPGWRVEQIGILVFSLGLATDLALLPQVVDRQSEGSYLMEAGLFVAFDFAVFARLAVLRARVSTEAWRRWYGVMALAAAGFLILDGIAFAVEQGRLPNLDGPLYDLAWYLPFWGVALACSLATPQPMLDPRASPEATAHFVAEEATSQGSLALYASAFIVLHLVAGLTGVTPAEASALRDVFAIGVLVVLGALAYYRQRGLERSLRSLVVGLYQATLDLAQTQRLQAVSRLAGGIAHDFNNLLTIIMGHSELIQRQLPQDTTHHRDLGQIQEAARRAARLTSDLLVFGQHRPLRPHLMSVGDPVERCRLRLAGSPPAGVELTVIHDSSAPLVNADPEQLELVMDHLVRNALEAMPGGGRLRIETSQVVFGSDRAGRPGPVQPDTYACISVEDTGRGIDQEAQRHLFEPFFTRKGFGRSHGLGLAIVHGVVRAHGGHLLVRSEVGKGTRFDLLLPAHDSLLPAPPV
jgi:signal transduction histidine kinase